MSLTGFVKLRQGPETLPGPSGRVARLVLDSKLNKTGKLVFLDIQNAYFCQQCEDTMSKISWAYLSSLHCSLLSSVKYLSNLGLP